MAAFTSILKKHSAKIILALLPLALIYWIWVIPPKYVGYAPDQPIPFSHKIHAGEMNMDCQFCHAGVEKSAHATVPDTATCMKCHQHVASDSKYIQYLRTTYQQGIPLRWNKVHDLPDHARFSHKPHIAKGLDCTACHGDMREVEGKVAIETAFNMGWCVNCHRDYVHETQEDAPGNNVTARLTECSTCHY